jgi:hypothetical protein
MKDRICFSKLARCFITFRLALGCHEEIYMAKRDEIMDVLEEKRKNNKKGAMTIAQFKLISELLWTEQNGLEQDVV